MKKLIPALCMLLVAACLMGTSTYAWFAANTQVTANGMQVKAASSGGLAIASYKHAGEGNFSAPEDADYGPLISANWSNQILLTNPMVYPTSHTGTAWYKADATAYDASTGTNYQPVDADDTNKHYQLTKWRIKSLAEGTTSTLKVAKITVEDNTNSLALNESLRVAICVGGTEWFYFAPLKSATTGLNRYTGSAPAAYPDGRIFAGDTPNATLTTALTSTPVEIEVYVYYEGEDAQCKSSNITTTVDTLKVTIVYTNA